MDKLSELLQEAKPLYKKQKRNKTIINTLLGLCLPVMAFSGLFQLYLEGNNIYLSLDNNALQTELLQDDFDLLR